MAMPVVVAPPAVTPALAFPAAAEARPNDDHRPGTTAPAERAAAAPWRRVHARATAAGDMHDRRVSGKRSGRHRLRTKGARRHERTGRSRNQRKLLHFVLPNVARPLAEPSR